MRGLFVFVVTLLVVACATTPVTVSQLEQKTSARVLSEQEIRDRLVGKELTAVFSEKGNTCSLHIAEDGSAKGSSSRTDESGTWSFKTTEGGLPVLVLDWRGPWGVEKGTIIEKGGKLSMVSPSGGRVYHNIEARN